MNLNNEDKLIKFANRLGTGTNVALDFIVDRYIEEVENSSSVKERHDLELEEMGWTKSNDDLEL